ncbi:hypothetical protein [Streptomyces sp. NL15-2K]|uniref:hypothetical protein n=1 Tax=Streptomyces sp. NL15-2K TaxID=376149 RepID=UPI000FFA94DD|nr:MULTISPECIES: hypothetical protein [Actinomycetes]WKX11872.1 hypothetical protein Q4V64_31930 [Kutzneria buriramensis]GCB46640.1 hypothetical protein SNL152K_3938 [Streptomyces sp. NL15-2K]
MTTDRLSEPRERDSAEGAADAVRGGYGVRAENGPTTTVPVMPLWERLRTGVRG